MNKSLQDIIDHYKNGLLETRNLQISNEKFLTEVICDERLDSSSFKNLSLINLNFTNIDFESSFFKECLFKNCIFESTSLQDAEFVEIPCFESIEEKMLVVDWSSSL